MNEARHTTSTLANTALALGLLSVPAQLFIGGGGAAVLISPVLGVTAIVIGIGAFFLARFRGDHFRGLTRSVLAVALGTYAALTWNRVWQSIDYPRRSAVCASNLRGIGQALSIYAADVAAYPPNLHTLVDAGFVAQCQLTCPLDWRREAEDEPSYVYVTGLLPDGPPDWIVAYDDPANHPRPTVNVLFLSGEVKNIKMDDFIEEMRRFREAYAKARGEPPQTVGPTWP